MDNNNKKRLAPLQLLLQVLQILAGKDRKSKLFPIYRTGSGFDEKSGHKAGK